MLIFFIDDVIWPFRDLTRNRPTSIFDQTLLSMLKEAHDKYGLKVVLNAFYRTDFFYGEEEFTLADMTDAYKAEWEANSDWLKIAFHAKQEFPDYPHVNIDYEDMKKSITMFNKEVIRFAGETTEYNGDPNSLPYGHAMRLLHNRKPETKIFSRGSRDVAINNSLCAYNHISTEEYETILGTPKFIYNEEVNIYFKHFCNGACLNLSPIDELESDMTPAMGSEYVCCATHEQYSYPDYLAYQPESRDKLMKMCEVFEKHGYEYIFVEDLLSKESL